jgi:hypothetical protein
MNCRQVGRFEYLTRTGTTTDADAASITGIDILLLRTGTFIKIRRKQPVFVF